MIGDKECLNCGQNLIDLPGKRKKVFCNSSCRSNYWQKSDRLEKEGKSIEEIVSILSSMIKAKKSKPKKVQDLSKPNTEIKPVEQPKSNYVIDTGNKNPTTLSELKALCPPELTGFERSEWVSKKRIEYGV